MFLREMKSVVVTSQNSSGKMIQGMLVPEVEDDEERTTTMMMDAVAAVAAEEKEGLTHQQRFVVATRR